MRYVIRKIGLISLQLRSKFVEKKKLVTAIPIWISTKLALNYVLAHGLMKQPGLLSFDKK